MAYIPRYDSGDWKALCDVCGREYKASQLTKRWDGLMCCRHDWEPRQPQDFVRGVDDNQTVPWSRPEPADQFITFAFTAPAVVISAPTAVTIATLPIWAPWNPHVTSYARATIDIAKRTPFTLTSINGSPLNTKTLG